MKELLNRLCFFNSEYASNGKPVFKKFCVSLLLTLLFASFLLPAFASGKEVSPEEARNVGEKTLTTKRLLWLSKPSIAPRGFIGGRQYRIGKTHRLKSESRTLAYFLSLKPSGFIVVSGNTDLRPIIAYSFNEEPPYFDDLPEGSLTEILRSDLTVRFRALPVYPAKVKQRNKNLWTIYSNYDTEKVRVSETSEVWGPWLETTWEQGTRSFYNDSLPDDPNTEAGLRWSGSTWMGGTSDGRVLTGCAPLAFGQILYYWGYPKSITLEDSDKYTSRYGPGDGNGERVIDIDGDHEKLSFPSFQELNSRLSDIDYSGDQQEIADLLFALGIIVEAGYSDAASSSYVGPEDYLYGLGYESARKITPSDPDFYPELKQDMKNGNPSQMSIERLQNGVRVGGHSIVADGYKSSGEYHLNFGWGPYQPDPISEAWYFLPEGLPEEYDAVGSAIIDIEPPVVIEQTPSVFRITKEGRIYADGSYYGENFVTGYADVAETVKISEPVEPGDLLSINPDLPGHYRKSQRPYSDLAAGVVSTNPGMELTDGSDGKNAKLALVGTVPVKATAENGLINPGDLLTTSSKPGYAMVCKDRKKCAGAIVGKALGTLVKDEGRIRILIVR